MTSSTASAWFFGGRVSPVPFILSPFQVFGLNRAFAGGHVISLAAEDAVNAVAAISRCPYTGRLAPVKLTWGFIRTMLYAVVDSMKQRFGLEPLYIPAAAPPGSVGAMVAPGSVEGLSSIALKDGDWPNKMSASSLFQFPPYDPRKTAASIKCPIFVVVCRKDALCPAENAQKVVEAAPKGEALLLDEAGHFDIYPGAKFYEASVESELEFLRRVVPA
ncbi:hypothetical protein GALMADRAFT_137681 [Galerina marginata CBS 339.88]|uniref:Uncharacterized protein n=1 Tax=Galerina marginata (strain CBS 339.88) TaxID=685588 RepID=A0A067T8G3_GALM3|nr:hypothetical protein GALMADRAFT_137681 [Galerina marginata CBS 339.88]